MPPTSVALAPDRDAARPGGLTRAIGLRNFHLLAGAALLVFLPLAIFAARLALPAAVAIALGTALGATFILRSPARGALLLAPLSWTRFGALLAASLAFCAIGGEGHFFFAASDWMTRDSVLADLALNKFPVFYEFQNSERLLRAPLGAYMAPALVGWSFGLTAAHLALLAQNAFLLAVILYFALAMAQRPGAQFVALLLLFSPVDVIPRLAIDAYQAGASGAFVVNPLTMFWNPAVKFWGQTPSLFWAPNHALPAWLFATLLLLEIRREIDFALLALIGVALLFWSPLAMIGAAPFLLWRLAAGWRALDWRRAVTGALAALALTPVVIYLTLDADAMTRGWAFLEPGFWGWYGLALIFALPHAWLLLARFDDVAPWLRPALSLTVVLQLAMPFFKLGAAPVDNDMVMRCALAPVFLLAFAFADSAQAIIDRGRVWAFCALALIMLSAYTGLMEIRRGLFDQAYAINDCNLATSTSKLYPGFSAPNYFAVADAAPAWLVSRDGPRLAIERRQCWPGYAGALGN